VSLSQTGKRTKPCFIAMMDKAKEPERALSACCYGSDGGIQSLKERNREQNSKERKRCLSMAPRVKTTVTDGVWLAERGTSDEILSDLR
jgi:hypothetical protein